MIIDNSFQRDKTSQRECEKIISVPTRVFLKKQRLSHQFVLKNITTTYILLLIN